MTGEGPYANWSKHVVSWGMRGGCVGGAGSRNGFLTAGGHMRAAGRRPSEPADGPRSPPGPLLALSMLQAAPFEYNLLTSELMERPLCRAIPVGLICPRGATPGLGGGQRQPACLACMQPAPTPLLPVH